MTTVQQSRVVQSLSQVDAAERLRVNIAVSGVFHYRQFVKYLSDAGLLQRFYYSHRRATTSGVLGIRTEEAVNLWAKEYLTHAHLRAMSHRLGNVLFPLYQDLFDRGVVRNWADGDILHVMLHGAARRTIHHARARSAIVIGEPVNSHPEFVQQLLREEHERLGIPATTVNRLNRGQAQTVQEAGECDYLLAPSRFVADSYIAHGASAEKVHVLPWGADTTRFQPGTRNRDGIFRVICVAQISPRKGHVDLLDAWKLLNLPNSELVFLGEPTPEMQVVLARRQDRVNLRGHVPHEKLAGEIQQADVVVLPSIEDGFSYVPLEAMACGVPVIVSANAGASEIVEEGVTGFVIPIRSPQRIAEAIQTLYESPELRAEMGSAARREIVHRHSWPQYAERLAACYQQVRMNSSNGRTDRQPA